MPGTSAKYPWCTAGSLYRWNEHSGWQYTQITIQWYWYQSDILYWPPPVSTDITTDFQTNNVQHNLNWLVFMKMMAYWLKYSSSAEPSEESIVGTKLARRCVRVIPSNYYGQNIISPMIISTVYLLISVCKGILRGPAYTYNVVCNPEMLLISKNNFFAPAPRSQYLVHLETWICLLWEE